MRIVPAEVRTVIKSHQGPDREKITRNRFDCSVCGLPKGGLALELHDHMICADCAKELSVALGTTVNSAPVVEEPKKATREK